jgi:hypothetical protein
MADPIVSPDGRYVLINGEWVELAQQQVSLQDSVISGNVTLQSTVNVNTRQPEDEIRNLAELAVVKLSAGDMASVKEAYTEAKKINVSIAQKVFEQEYAVRLGSGYVDIVEYYGNQITTTFVTVSGQNFGTAGMLWDVSGNHELSAMISQQNIALNNAISFLGSPSEYAEMSHSELSTIDEEMFEQLFRLGQECKYSGNTVLSKTNRAHVTTDGVTLRFINQLRLEALQLSTLGSAMIVNITTVDVKSEKYQMPNWQAKYSLTVAAADQSENWSEHLGKEKAKKAREVQSAQDAELFVNLVVVLLMIGFAFLVAIFGNI